jgi:hypothetical protein
MQDMNEPERRTRGIVRISMHSIIKVFYGDTGCKAISMKVDRYDRSILELTISHPALPETKHGKRLPRLEIKRTYEQTQE